MSDTTRTTLAKDWLQPGPLPRSFALPPGHLLPCHCPGWVRFLVQVTRSETFSCCSPGEGHSGGEGLPLQPPSASLAPTSSFHAGQRAGSIPPGVGHGAAAALLMLSCTLRVQAPSAVLAWRGVGRGPNSRSLYLWRTANQTKIAFFFSPLVSDTRKEELYKGNSSGNKRERERRECKQSRATAAVPNRGAVITADIRSIILPEIPFESARGARSFDPLLPSPR